MKRTILAPGHELLSYRIHEVTPYINWIYFFHAWGFQPRFAAIANIHGCDSCRALWLTTFPEEERTKASEAMQLFKEANRMLGRLDETISIHCIFRLCQANADGDNLLIEGTTFPLLRQQTPQPDGGPFLCLSDFVRPLSSGGLLLVTFVNIRLTVAIVLRTLFCACVSSAVCGPDCAVRFGRKTISLPASRQLPLQ